MKIARGAFVFLAAGILCGLRLCAQVQSPVNQAPSPMAQEIGESQDGTTDTGEDVRPDSRALSGAIVPGVGSWGPRHSFVLPGLKFAQSLDGNPMFQDPGAYRGFTSAVGQIQAIQYLGRSSALRYAGAARFDSSATIYGANRFTNTHSAVVNSGQQWGQWTLTVNDQAHYWQGSLAGDTGMDGLGTITTQVSQWLGAPGIQLDSVALQSGLEPDQSILSARASRLSNISLAEIDRQLGTRDVVTATGYYGLLHFFTSGLIDNKQKGMLAGYDHRLSERDRLGVVYGFSQTDFSSTSNSIQTSYGQLMYGRAISGRLAMQVGAGPQYTISTSAQANDRNLTWQGRGNLTMQLRAANLQLSAQRMVTGGAGVLYGAQTNQVQFSASRNIGRTLSLDGNVGITRNQALLGDLTYDTRHVGASASSNPSGRLSAFFSYDLQYQASSGCSGSDCALTGTWQVFAAGISWRTRPIGVQ